MKDDYPGAAAKHVDDCAALLVARRFDGAGYLAGYVVECAIKTLIEVEGSCPRDQRHDLGSLSRKALQLAAMPGQRTGRYIKHPDVTTLNYGLPTGWDEELRYQGAGRITEATATTWVTEARRLHNEVIIPMRLDGVI